MGLVLIRLTFASKIDQMQVIGHLFFNLSVKPIVMIIPSTTSQQPLVVLTIAGKSKAMICENLIMERLNPVITAENKRGNPPLRIQSELWKYFKKIEVPGYNTDYLGVYPVEPMICESQLIAEGNSSGALINPTYTKALDTVIAVVLHGALNRIQMPTRKNVNRVLSFFQVQQEEQGRTVTTVGSISAMRYPDRRLYFFMNVNLNSCVFPGATVAFTY